jgi:AraC-like DNA-binding protein
MATKIEGPDPLDDALARKALSGARGTTESRVLAAGDGWRVVDVVCTCGPADRPFEERQRSVAISLVLAGTFSYRSARGTSLLAPGALLLTGAGQAFECAHAHGEGDRCLSFQLEPELFERVARDAGSASRASAAFASDRVPPLRDLAPHAARAAAALSRPDSFEEIALDLAGAVVGVAGRERPTGRGTTSADAARIARVLRRLEAATDERHALADLARVAGLSRYHFLRTFKAVTGVTPHQWLLRARLRLAAERLATTRAPVTEVALEVGFGDLSNFVRSFRAEFGVSPGRYRAAS